MSEELQAQIKDIDIGKEMRNSFMDYAMSVIVSRALPDVRDGLKPVHRRILFAMSELGMTPDKPYKKSARIVGEVIGKYHPHGDSAVYDTMVRMAQDFSYRCMLVDGHGNFGSVDGDAPAAMRYTEAKLSRIATELLRDIQKETIDFIPNYDGEEREPSVLPARFPNLLVNGSAGIAVGMATNIPPHNLGEVIDGVLNLIENPDITPLELMEVIPGPDFPTAGYIVGRSGIREAYVTGRGSIKMRAKVEIEDHNGKARIIVSELPYQVNKANLIAKIAELVREKKIEGITDLRDESNRDGMRIVIELRRDVNPNVVLNNLYKQTAMQSYFGINMLALVDGEPRILNIKEILQYYLLHQQQVIRRRTEFDLRKAEARAHILEGYRIAFENLDEVIKVIRESENPDQDLVSRFGLSEVQAKAILDMQIRRISKLEVHKIEQEYQELMVKIAEYKLILSDEGRILNIVAEELREIKATYIEGKQKEEGRNRNLRQTEILPDEDDILNEDLIPREEVIVSLTRSGYVKRLPVSTYRLQKRGGRGVIGMDTKEDDFVEHLIGSNSHHFLLFFTNKGKVYRLKAYEIPGLSRTSRGTPIINLINIDQGETIKAVIPVEKFNDDKYLVFVTRNGVIKRTSLDEYSNIRRVGLNAINLREDDDLIAVRMTDGSQQIVMGTRKGMSIRFAEQDARTLGRTATGVKGITLASEDYVIDADVVSEDDDVLIVSTKGMGKRTPMSEYRLQNRGGRGVRTLNITEKSGECVALKVVRPEEDLLIITASGTIIRVRMQEITSKGRFTMGVKLINTREDDEVGTVAIVEAADEADELEDEDAVTDETTAPNHEPEE